MKTLTLTAIAAFALAAVSPAMAQGASAAPPPVSHMTKMQGPSMRDVMMQGLTAAEKKTAMELMKKSTAGEKAAMTKRCSMCMKDPHKGMSASMKPTEKQKMDHMMAGMSKAEQASIMGLMKRMTPAEHKVAVKMVTNCCMYGMKHAGMIRSTPPIIMKKHGG